MARHSKVSAGLLLFRRVGPDIEFFLAHPGGPFWRNKEEGAWTIPKGVVEQGESPLAAAIREFEEETGVPNLGTLADLTFFEPPPPAGVGMQCSVVDEFAYGHVTVTKDQLTVQPRDIDGNPLLDAGIPCGPFVVNKE